MAYLSLVEYDRGGRVRTLEGEVMYDNGGRVRHLLGAAELGQDVPIDLPLTSSDQWTPIVPPPMPVSDGFTGLPDNWYTPTGPESAPIAGELTPPNVPMPTASLDPSNPLLVAPFHPDPSMFSTQSAPITGSLMPPRPSGPAPIVSTSGVQEATGIIASVSNIFKSIFGGTVQAASLPATQTGGHVTAAGAALASTGGLVAPSWFTDPAQEVISGVPNWGVAAGGAALAFALFAGGSKYRSSYGGPRRKRNPAELILMGANPRRRRKR